MTFDLLRQLATAPMMIARALVLDRDEFRELARIHASNARWPEQPAPVAQPAPFDAERYLGALLSATRADVERLTSELAQRTRERDAARRGINGVSAPLLERTVALGKANAEIEQLRADVVRLTSELDAIDDAALESAETLKRLREDLAAARNQLPGTPGQTVTLHLENGTTTTGRLEIHHNQRTVRGFLVDVVGRSVVVVPDGGGDRG